MTQSPDEFEGKGAVEQDQPGEKTNVSLTGQLGHRDQNALIKDNDSDFPEEGNSPEHSGEPEGKSPLSDAVPCGSPSEETVDQERVERQKRNQGNEKDDSRAA